MNHWSCSQLRFYGASEEQIHVGESPPLIIRTCRHIVESGCFCRAAAVRGRRYCRAHVLLRLKQRRMARARRKLAVVKLPRLIDLGAVKAAHTVVRVGTAAGRMDPACALLIHWALGHVASDMRFLERRKRQVSAFGSPSGRPFLPCRQQGP
jgi:hypothetical protein